MAGRVVENEDLVNMPNLLLTKIRPEGSDRLNLLAVEILSYRQEFNLKEDLLLRTVGFKMNASVRPRKSRGNAHF
ncbi:MAG: hypothetical protein FJ117_02480 [Deltaproteobacteria bacterium]|nr:hypothetical protein [Deltaproteobacteria bacterium]